MRFFRLGITSWPKTLRRSSTSRPCRWCSRCWPSQTPCPLLQAEKGPLGRWSTGRIGCHVTSTWSGRFSLAGWALDTSLLFYKRTATSVSPGPIGPMCRPLPRGHFRPPRWASVWSRFGSRCNRGRPEAPPILRHLTPRSGGKPDLSRTPTTGFSGRRPSCSVDLHCQAKEKDYGSGLTEKLHCFSIWQANGTGCLFQRLGSSYKPAFCFRQMATEIWWNSAFGFLKRGRHVLWPTLKVLWASFSGSEQENNVYFQGCNIVHAIFA